MIFETSIQGIRCRCEVTHYAAEVPMAITGSGFGDAEPPEPEEFDFCIRGIDHDRRLKGLEDRVTPAVRQKLINEYKEKLLDF